jgi:hypothetical protein
MAAAIYTLCALTAGVCTYLLLDAWRRSSYRLLLWSGLCFAGLTVNNLFLILDKVLFPAIDFSLLRTVPALIGMAILLYGLIWDSE